MNHSRLIIIKLFYVTHLNNLQHKLQIYVIHKLKISDIGYRISNKEQLRISDTE